MKKLVIMLVLAFAFALTVAVAGCDTSCGQDDRDSCSAEHSDCVNDCDPLMGDYTACVDGCDDDLCSCLDDHGCDCN